MFRQSVQNAIEFRDDNVEHNPNVAGTNESLTPERITPAGVGIVGSSSSFVPPFW
jgi:hypothetical protein